MHDQDLDQLPIQDLPGGSAGYNLTAGDPKNLVQDVANPFFGVVQTGTVSVCNPAPGIPCAIPLARLLLPYPQFDDVHMAEPDNRDSIYHSFQAKFQKRFSAGASILAAYTISKLIDNTNSEINWLEAAAPGWGDANAYNLRGERSLDGFDVPQRLVIGSVLDLPVGKGKALASNTGTLTDKVIGGWGINTIITFQSGYPIIVGGCPGALSNSGIPNAGCARPNRTHLSRLTGG